MSQVFLVLGNESRSGGGGGGPLRFTFDVDGQTVLDRAFNRIDRYISDFRNIWPGVAQEFYATEERQFQSEGASGASGRWAPLSQAYARFKSKVFPGQPILQQTSSLYESLTSPDALDSIFRPLPQELQIGTKVPYFRAHQRGSGRIPARPPISLTEPDKRRLQKAIQASLVAYTREQGFQVDERAT